ncbi:MAG: hypothetical protein FD146_2053 [Anaerolineaceae bacterium]|nr:MAG: hypothetical protein FD146_2053 [Anaerolineaceae bacterium]
MIGSRMVKLFGERMTSARSCVENLWDYKVNIEKEEDIKAILKDLVGTLNALSNYSEASKKTRIKNEQPLEADIVYRKLLLLANHLGSHLGWELRQILGDHFDKIPEDDTTELDKRYLRLNELAWLEDLLWYSLRFDVPDYLNMDEMAFRFSLRLHGLTRRELLQVITSTWAKPSPQEDIQQWIHFCELKRQPCELHLVLAAAAWHKFDTYKKNPSKRDIMPLLFTTNFDRNLELAFQHLKKPYHVIFPIRVKYKKVGKENASPKKADIPDSQKRPTIIWVLRTWQWGVSAYIMRPLKELPSEEELSKSIMGPVIVKLHGSPAESLEDDGQDELLNKYDDVKPYIILSEYDYLQTVVETEATKIFPNVLIDAIKLGSQWWFLGYPIDDLFIRLRIFQLISYTVKSAKPPVVKVLDPDFDFFRSHVVEAWNVQRLQTQLSTVVDVLKEIKEIKEILGEAG